ncbi:hypothetical protein [Terrarubrum flagellatum]|uniref:hypothetical protein n=1 Tax=Terrirubrum flagellatum TaxID=2895980 RepID=UPI0031455715
MDLSYNDRNIHATRMDHDHFAYSPFVSRPKFVWPNGAKLAVVVSIAVEFQDLIVPEGTWRPPGSPIHLDVRHWGHRDYGARVGVYRLASILQRLGVRATVPISDAVLTRSPRVAEYLSGLGWELLGHGEKSNLYITSAMNEAEEWAVIKGSYDAIMAATGVAPRGWMAPLQSESDRTPVLAARAGFDYTLDWSNDDQPYEMLPPEGRLLALPASVETSDAFVLDLRNQSTLQFAQVLRDHFDALLAESAATGLAMTVNLQAHRSGQPFRSKYIAGFLAHAKAQEGVWFATGSEVADAWRAATGKE